MVPLGGDVILSQRFVLSSTIIVTDAAGQLVYGLGIDYEVFELTSDLTQIQAIPGGRIETGSTILVSYKSQILPSQEFSTTIARVSLGFSLPWMSFSHYNFEVKNDLLSGDGESFLTDRRDMTTRLGFNWRMSRIDASVSAERRYSKVNDFESTAYTFHEQFGWAATDQVIVSLNFLQQFTETTDLDTDLYNMRLSVEWRPRYNLSILPVLSAWKRRDTWLGGERDDTFLMAGIRLRWFYRRLTFDLDYNGSQRTINEAETIENRLFFNLRRRF